MELIFNYAMPIVGIIGLILLIVALCMLIKESYENEMYAFIPILIAIILLLVCVIIGTILGI